MIGLFLQLFLLVDVFLIGVILTVAISHAKAHRQTHQQGAPHATEPTVQTDYIPPMMRERLVKESQAKFQDALNNSAVQLEHSLGSTATQLDRLLRELGTEIVGNELERYRLELSELRKQAQADMDTVKTEITAHRAELEKQLADELAAEKQRLLQQIDTKLADAVASFLLETLQHEVDLGAQEAYLRSMLDEHKADFTREVSDEAKAA